MHCNKFLATALIGVSSLSGLTAWADSHGITPLLPKMEKECSS